MRTILALALLGGVASAQGLSPAGKWVSNLKFFAENFKGCNESCEINPFSEINCSKLLIIRFLDFNSLPTIVNKLSGFMFQFCSNKWNFDFLFVFDLV